MKLNKKTAGAVIFVILLLFLFFSKTIYTFNMPEVSGTRPKRGTLSKLEISSGIASWAETESIYAVSGGSAGRVYVKEGEEVEKGQLLFEMDYDIAAVERRLSEADNNITKNEADLRNMITRYNNIRYAMAAFHSGDDTNLSPQAGLIVFELDRARNNVEITRIEYEIGGKSRNDLINAENDLKALLLKYEAETEELQSSILIKDIDLENLRLARQSIAALLRDYRNNVQIRSPADGVILYLAAERGKFFPENALLATVGAGDEFVVECTISLDNNFVNPGDICQLSNASHTLRGTVTRVRPSSHGKTVTISVTSGGETQGRFGIGAANAAAGGTISEGETFEVTFEKNSAADFILVPSGALNQDNDGYFVYQIKRRKGIMGDEYYVERLNVFIGDSDRQNTAIVRGITFFEPIVLTSSKMLSAGLAVTLKNAEDFFEN